MRPALCLALAFLASGAVAQSHRIDSIDPPLEGQEFPGGRGAEMMVLYTPAYASPDTGTNEWGVEAVIERGVVTTVGSNDSVIPSEGAVLSGHGEARNWINQNLFPGVAVRWTSDEIAIDDTPEGRWRSMAHRVTQLNMNLAEVRSSDEVREMADQLSIQIHHMGGRDGTLDLEQLDFFETMLEDLEDDALMFTLAAVESPAGEVRGVWHRLTETTPASIEALADDLAATHVNAFFPEVIYGSHAIYPEPTGLYDQWGTFGETDGLAELIDVCHARGIEVHAWVHCFFIGVQGSDAEPPLLAQRHPEWLEMNRLGQTVSSDEERYIFLNPAHPEVRRAMIEAYVAMASSYEIDGLHLDYIRYANATSLDRLWGFSDFTRERVREELGFDPMEIEEGTDEWHRFLDWREEQIGSFVHDVADAVRAVRPGIRITAAVFPDLPRAIEIKGQNWAAWAEHGDVDALLPMAYFTDPESVRSAVEEMASVLPSDDPRVVGLAPFLGLQPEQLLAQIEAARAAGATGQCLFAWDTITPPVKEMLSHGPWREVTEAQWLPAN